MEDTRSTATVEQTWETYDLVVKAARGNFAYRDNPPALDGDSFDARDFLFELEDRSGVTIPEDEARNLFWTDAERLSVGIEDFGRIARHIIEKKYGGRS